MTEALATTAAIDIVNSAPGEAAAYRAEVVGQEHLLLAITARSECLGARVLGQAIGSDAATFRAEITALMRSKAWRDAPPRPQPTPRVLNALDEAHAEASENNRAVTTADILIGILRTHVGVGFQLLSFAGANIDAIRAATSELLAASAELEDTAPATLSDALTLASA